MAPKKGLSFEEKRDRLLDLFTESSEFFTLKELERVATKRKGIVSQSVKEVLQSLADDDLVSSDKCGNQTLFWCLASEASQKKKAKLERLRVEREQKEQTLQDLKVSVEEMQAGREETEEHAELIKSIHEKSARSAQLSVELARYAACDPEFMDKLNESIPPVRDAANRWTDNIFCCQSWVTQKFGVDRAAFFEQFEIPEDIDYLE